MLGDFGMLVILESQLTFEVFQCLGIWNVRSFIVLRCGSFNIRARRVLVTMLECLGFGGLGFFGV